MTRTTVVRVVIVLLIVVPPLGLFQRSARIEKRLSRDEQTIRDQGRKSSCAQIAAAETLIKAVAESPPAFFTAHDQLLLTRFVQKVGRDLQASASCR